MPIPETIICDCLTEHTISSKTTCPKCRRNILTSKELRELQVEYDAQCASLKIKSAQIEIELHLRSVRKPSRVHLLREDFFAGFNKRERKELELKAMAQSLLDQV